MRLCVGLTAPVSQPDVSQMCLSAEQMTVSCSAEGDEVEFILSLDSNTLIQTRAGSAPSQSIYNVTISLHGHLVGTLVCKVQNNVSRKQTVIQVMSCAGS